MHCGRGIDVKIATSIFGRMVVYTSADKSYAMTTGQGSEIATLPFFAQDKTWEDDVVVSILQNRFVTIDMMVLNDGYHVRFITLTDEAHDIPYLNAETEQEAICLAALDFKKRFPAGSIIM